MKYMYILITFLSISLSVEQNTYSSGNYTTSSLINGNQYTNQYESNQSHNFKDYNFQILHEFIDPNNYMVGPGDIFLFNMVISNRIINLELITSPTGDVLIPVVGTINVKGKILNDVYSMIIDKCRSKYEDAYIYVNLIKLRKFKVFVTGNFMDAGMYSVASTNRVSDLIESIMTFNSHLKSDSLLYFQLSDYPKHIMFNKDIFLIREDSTINVNLFDFYINSNFDSNPYLKEGDIIKIKDSKKIAILGAIDNPIRVDKQLGITYGKLLESSKVDKDKLKSMKILNYNMLKNYSSIEIDRISDIESEYRSDFDESFLTSRIRAQKGLVYINNKKDLNKWLDLEVSDGDIIIIPNQFKYIEIIGAINSPGSYKLNSQFTVLDYLNNAGGLSENAKNRDIYIIDDISGVRVKVEESYKPMPGDVIFIEGKLGYKQWKRFTESIKLVGTLSTMIASIINVLWIIDRIESNN
tara:strand:+ start:272 stop:1675 length:1404 start_codon:yes stop_codon:yes gene_type:complete